MRALGVLVLVGYQCLLSPLVHLVAKIFGAPCQCHFVVSCSEFALGELRANPSFVAALCRIATRLMICSPVYGALSENLRSKFLYPEGLCGRRG